MDLRGLYLLTHRILVMMVAFKVVAACSGTEEKPIERAPEKPTIVGYKHGLMVDLGQIVTLTTDDKLQVHLATSTEFSGVAVTGDARALTAEFEE